MMSLRGSAVMRSLLAVRLPLLSLRCPVLALLLLAASGAAALGGGSDDDSDRRPNVILLLLDDAGWKDLGCFGGRMRTPHIDRLAAEGMRFTDCHSPASNCSPSRAGILTGRIPARAGIYSYLPDKHPMHLRADEVTVAELARQAGYRTGLFGKWHLSDLANDQQPGPGQQGFEYWLATSNNAAPSHRNPVNFVRNGQPVGKIDGYSCQIVVDEALTWLKSIGVGQRTARPFLACLWFHEPHTPIASPPELIDAYRQRYPEISARDAAYLANIENVDIAVGRLLERLEAWGVADDTVIWCTSDNGPLSAFSRGKLRGFKSNVWEGGHRVPGIVRWPGRIAGGSECHVPVSGIDFLPTFCQLAGIELPRDRVIDGVSLLPLWEGRQEDFRRPTPLYWFFYRLNPSLAIRDGDWALVAHTDDAQRPKAHQLLREDLMPLRQAEPNRFELYHLGNDLGQSNNIALEHPAQLEQMKRQLVNLHREIMQQSVWWDIPADYGASAAKRVWNSE
jgi:arylsulfatase A